jgi:hypothetical protein
VKGKLAVHHEQAADVQHGATASKAASMPAPLFFSLLTFDAIFSRSVLVRAMVVPRRFLRCAARFAARSAARSALLLFPLFFPLRFPLRFLLRFPLR